MILDWENVATAVPRRFSGTKVIVRGGSEALTDPQVHSQSALFGNMRFF